MSVEQATRIEQLITAEQFAEMLDTPGKQYELACGEVMELPGTGYPHATIVKVLFLLLNAFVTTHDLGEVYPDGLAYIVARAPDSVRPLTYLSSARCVFRRTAFPVTSRLHQILPLKSCHRVTARAIFIRECTSICAQAREWFG